MKEDGRETLREARAEYRKWENSFEGVAYWLGDLPVQESLERVIVEAVRKLPRKTREFVYHNCRFSATDDDGVRMRYIPQSKQLWLITLGNGLQDESLLVHEIAHAWLGHEWDPQCGALRATDQDEEIACELTKEWGFTGAGTERLDRPH